MPPLKRQTSCVEEIGRTEKSMLKLKAKSARLTIHTKRKRKKRKTK